MTTDMSGFVRVYGRIGLLSFGGPAAQIALMHKELVEDRAWLSERDFLSALSFCMLLPGPEAMQLATFAGWKQRGVTGGLIAGGLFVLPGALVIFALALLYAKFGAQPFIQAAFLGVKAAIVVIVFQALMKVSKKALQGRQTNLIAVLSFVALFAFGLPFPVIVLLAALVGAWRLAPSHSGNAALAIPPVAASLRAAGIGVAAWGTPLLVLALTGQSLLLEIGLFFSKLALVTFGGAYAVLAYMTQTVVQDHGWLSTAQMMDALGLAETTPGPLILVTQFVAVLTGFLAQGWGMAIAAGLVALWVTFVPCFLWIFAAAPYVDWLTAQPRLQGALRGITAAVVGVIANLSVWFALHVAFDRVTLFRSGMLQFALPDLHSVNLLAITLGTLAAVLMLGLQWSMLRTLAACASTALAVAAF